MSTPQTPAPEDSWRALSTTSLLQLIEQADITGMGGGGFPTAQKLTVALEWQAANAAETIRFIANGVACEPGIDADLWIMERAAEDVLLGALIVARILATDVLTLALGPRLQHLAEPLQTLWQTLATPQSPTLLIHESDSSPAAGAERLLIEAVTGVRADPQSAPAAQGFIVQNVTTLWAIGRVVVTGEPASRRPVTVGTETQWLALGSRIADLPEAAGCNRDGGHWSSVPLAADAVVRGSTLALHQQDPQSPMPCIGCGECAAICPVAIDPEALHRIGTTLPQRSPTVSDTQSYNSPVLQLQRAGIDDCVECGACNVSCPSHIDLVADFRRSKRVSQQASAALAQAARASARYERHEQRLANRAAAAASKRSARLQRTRSWEDAGDTT
ncbi:MAG: 4Fe-4S dicluster domain-containing protein [Pseudomonadales bacterium]